MPLSSPSRSVGRRNPEGFVICKRRDHKSKSFGLEKQMEVIRLWAKIFDSVVPFSLFTDKQSNNELTLTLKI